VVAGRSKLIEASAVGFALTLQPMLMKLREAERLLNETYFIASTIEQRLKLHIPSFIWNQVQQLDSGITKAHFLKNEVINSTKGVLSSSLHRIGDTYYEQSLLQDELETLVDRLIVQSMNMNIKLERMMASASEAERAEFERQMDEMGDGYNG